MDKFVKNNGVCSECSRQGQVRRNPDWRPNDDWLCLQCYDKLAKHYLKLGKAYLKKLKNPEFAKAEADRWDELDELGELD